ncbi:MAG TPA: alpha/beta fold hydrolase [Candidatus Acidoferrum sp.]|nr:alpha/beta fold hydrolase [Candidatus Acidoferrum sp.]
MTKPARVEVSLVRLRTRDGVWLDGAVAEPSHRRAALIWVHGLGSVFSSGQVLIRELSSRLNAAGIGYFKFNNRGHDIVAGRGRHLAGAAFERFGQSVADIRTMIAFAATRGYSKIILAGHSTGANKVLYYAARVRDRRVTALVLLGPVSDIAAAAQQVGAQELRRRVAAAERLARRDPQALVPRAWGFWSARRYISLYRPGEDEDVFPYYRPGARWTALRSVRLPMAAIIGSRDEYLDRPPQELIDTFRRNAVRARSFTGVVLRGARHGFEKRERELADVIVRWAHDLRVPTSRSG